MASCCHVCRAMYVSDTNRRIFYGLHKSNGTGLWRYSRFPGDLILPSVATVTYNDHMLLTAKSSRDGAGVLFVVVLYENSKIPPF